MTLGERIKLYRIDNNLSQEELAEKINVSRQAITKWESDNGIPDIDNLIQLSKLMNISLDELVLGKNNEKITGVEEQAARERDDNRWRYLIGIIGFSVAILCWIISCIINICNGNDLAAVLNVICVILLIIPITKLLEKYLNMK